MLLVCWEKSKRVILPKNIDTFEHLLQKADKKKTNEFMA